MKNRNGKKDYNSREHQETFTGPELFTPEPLKGTDVSVAAVPRSSTWGKIFDFENEGLTENNYQAYTYDFTIANNTKDEVSDYSFTLTFDQDVFLASAWNGAERSWTTLKVFRMSGKAPITTMNDTMGKAIRKGKPARISPSLHE